MPSDTVLYACRFKSGISADILPKPHGSLQAPLELAFAPQNAGVLVRASQCKAQQNGGQKMASIRKRGNSYLLVVSMGYDYAGNRMKPVQKTVKPPSGLTQKQTEKWLAEQALLFEQEAKNVPQAVNKNITFAKFIEIWLEEIAPKKLALSTLVREKADIERILPHLGHYKLRDLRPEIFRDFYAKMRLVKSQTSGKPLAENTVEGLHSCICGILSDAVEQGYLTHNPAWRTYKYSGRKIERAVADEETVQKIIAALEKESIKYEVYFKLLIATGMRRGECCGLQWSDINWDERKIHISKNVVKVSHHDTVVKDPKTNAGDRYVYFSAAMESLLQEYRQECEWKIETYGSRHMTEDDYLFKRNDLDLPMSPSTFTWRFKLILKRNGLPENLNVHSLRHTNASMMIANGVDVVTAAGLLGHAQPSTTLDIYSHAFDKNKKKAHQALQAGLDL